MACPGRISQALTLKETEVFVVQSPKRPRFFFYIYLKSFVNFIFYKALVFAECLEEFCASLYFVYLKVLYRMQMCKLFSEIPGQSQHRAKATVSYTGNVKTCQPQSICLSTESLCSLWKHNSARKFNFCSFFISFPQLPCPPLSSTLSLEAQSKQGKMYWI